MKPTYEITTIKGEESITCLTCNRTSYHPKDIEYKYCAYCAKYHE